VSTCCDDKPANGAAVVPPVTFCTLNHTLTYDKGRLIKSPRSSPVADGIYPVATVTVQGGCITSISAGANVVYSACDPCVTPLPPTPPSAIPIDGDACNLTSDAGGSLLTQLITAPSSCILFNGCGTAGSPLSAVPRISADAGNALECRPSGLFAATGSGGGGGLNFVGCGITVSNGLITSLPIPYRPVLDLYNDDGTMQITRDVGNPCRVRLRALADSGLPEVNLACGAGVVTASASLPNPVTTFCFAAVGPSNPRDFWVFVQGIGWRQLLGVTINI
jgi:hypothetical protein